MNRKCYQILHKLYVMASSFDGNLTRLALDIRQKLQHSHRLRHYKASFVRLPTYVVIKYRNRIIYGSHLRLKSHSSHFLSQSKSIILELLYSHFVSIKNYNLFLKILFCYLKKSPLVLSRESASKFNLNQLKDPLKRKMSFHRCSLEKRNKANYFFLFLFVQLIFFLFFL